MDFIVEFFVTSIFHFRFCLSFRTCTHYNNFYCTFSFYLPLTNPDIMYVYSCSYYKYHSLDKEKPCRGRIRGLNLAVDRPTTVQTTNFRFGVTK
jgi:hypothetical protein